MFFPPNLSNTPLHIDFYNYYAFSQSKFSLKEVTYPRPIFWLYLRLVGLFHDTELFYLFLAFPSMIFIALSFYFLVRNNLIRLNFPNFILFHSVLFLSPTFFIQFKLDLGAMLAGIFAIMALMYLLEMSKNEFGNFRHLLFRITLFTWLSAEAKPQFSTVIVFFTLFYFLFKKRYWLLVPLLIVILVPSATLLKDKYLDSPFLMNAGSGSPYAVVFQPVSVIKGILYYIEKSFTLGTLVLFGLIVLLQIIHKQFTSLAILTGLLISILFPLALIPNHLAPSYAWFGTYVIAIWLTIGLDYIFTKSKKSWFRPIAIPAAILTIFILPQSIYSPKYLNFNEMSIEHNTYVNWILDRQTENGNLENTTRIIEAKNLKNVLIGGVYGPWHLLRNSDFVRAAYPRLGKYYVYLQNSESVWNSVARDMDTGISSDEIYKHKFEWLVLVNSKGNITKIVPWSKFAKLDQSIQLAALDTGILLETRDTGRTRYITNQSLITSLMKANSHDIFLNDLERLYEKKK